MRKLSLLFLIIPLTFLLAEQKPFPRDPVVNNSGDMIAFSLQGDIFTIPFTGGEANRLTIHEAYESLPVWNSDGSKIAFNSTRYGNNDIYVTDAVGSLPKRITYHSSDDHLSGWTADNKILFTTSRLYNKVHWNEEIFTVSSEGGTPVRIMDSYGEYPVESEDGNLIAFVKGACRISREAYRGSANKDIWVYNKKTDTYHQVTDLDGNDYLPRWAGNNTLYFISAKAGKYNVFKISLKEDGSASSSPEQITSFDDFGVRYFDVTPDGNKMVIESGADIYTKTGNADPKILSVNVPVDYRFDPVERKTISSDASEFSVSPNGKYIAFQAEGEIFITENDKDKSRAVNISNHPFRDQYVTWLSDSTLIFSSDREGSFDLYLARSADANETDLFKTLKREIVKITDSDNEVTYPVMSPDYKKVAYENGMGNLTIADIDANGDISNEVELLNGWNAPGNVTFSPDGKWLAYSLKDLYYNSEIYIQPVDNSSEKVNVSMHPKGDYYPVWSPDGSKLAFVSERNNRNNDIWYVWLKKADWLKTKEDFEEEKDSKKDKKEDKDSTETNKDIVIDFENIHERLEQLTAFPGDESYPVFTNDGETIYYVMNATTGKSDRNIFKIKYDGSDLEQVTKGKTSPSSLTPDKDVKNIYYIKSGGRIEKLATSGDKTESISFSGKMELNHNKIREQVFEEGWRALNEYFYDPDFHGQDFDELKAKYKPLAERATTYEDFRVIYNDMLGQINASHMGLYGSGPENTQKDRTGLIGAEVKPVSDGVEVIHIIPNSPADRESSKLNEGDVITAVNQQKIDDNVNFYELLSNTAGEKVLLSVTRKNGGDEEIVIRPTTSLSSQLYEEWIESRKKLTEKYSDGRLGYLHIRGMDMGSFERFERELTASGHGKEGIVIDVRYNGGGWTTDYLMIVLNVKQHAYTIPRGAVDNLEKENKKFADYYPYGERLPYAAWTKPSIAMCNSMSYSNAEIFSHAYKSLGVGKLVGEPTFGAVISTGGRGLIDGSFIRLPLRAWYVKSTGMNMENNGAVPDYILPNEPDQDFYGDDAQLQKAVDVLLQQIDSSK